MILYVCPFGTMAGSGPGPFKHPCGRAAKALDDAGLVYETQRVGGAVGLPWTWRSRGTDRAEVEQLSGQRAVPILVLDDGEVIAGSGRIAAWAGAQAAR